MLVLGLNGSFSTPHDEFLPGLQLGTFFHDGTACLLDDGEVVIAIEEERLTRVKHTNMFPLAATGHCLQEAGVSLGDIDRIGYFWNEEHLDNGLGIYHMRYPGMPLRSAREMIVTRLSEAFSHTVDPERIDFWSHHEAHAASTFYQSGFPSALVVVMDGNGESHSTSVYRADESGLDLLRTYPESKSLGYYYLRATEALGYRLFDEFKVMGLAPYGDPTRYRELLCSLTVLGPDGEYDLDVDGLQTALLSTGFAPRRSGSPFTTEHKDLAASVQAHLEQIVFHVLEYWREEVGLPNLCIAGGVAHNSTVNGLILKSKLFDGFFVHPASHDAGAALGAAILTDRKFGTKQRPQPKSLSHVFWGLDIGDPQARTAELAAWSDFITWETSDDVHEHAAELLAQGAVIGWATGRSEFGPRALGHRSILADPRPAENKDRVNKLVKKREGYRPFAPAVLEERARDYFEIPDVDCPLDFMACTVPVKESHRDQLGAITHIDGTARVQVVRKKSNEAFWRLIERFGEKTGTPILLNTSFNNYAEPIVENIGDCLASFLTTGLDRLIVDDKVISRKPLDKTRLLTMHPRLPTLVEMAEFVQDVPDAGRETQHLIRRRDLHSLSSKLSHDAYRWISSGGTDRPEVPGSRAAALAEEVWRLWQGRFIELHP
ncbi:carbamoyltransferase family protein [Actinokineospora enzanensis]|uniref:carbamoyltransferase family protein n=1 Tax=Actinokineospora enzanensis TaxID=155975 RepID=UPI00039EB39B|nr:carbamoyltransferase C-terminal domain-containing protein [Actinokineospora enzanensis]